MWDQPDQEVSETKINSPDGTDQQLEGSDDDDVGPPLIIEESSNSEEGFKTAEYYTDDDDNHWSHHRTKRTPALATIESYGYRIQVLRRGGQYFVLTALNDGMSKTF